MKRAISIALAIVGVVALGAVLAVGVGLVYLWIHRPTPEQQKMAEVGKRQEYAYRQYKTADYPTAKKALLEVAQELDSLDAKSDRPHRNPHALDVMTLYVRLAKLEERNGGPAQAEFMKEASTRCEKLGRADCSEMRLRREVDQRDSLFQ